VALITLLAERIKPYTTNQACLYYGLHSEAPWLEFANERSWPSTLCSGQNTPIVGNPIVVSEMWLQCGQIVSLVCTQISSGFDRRRKLRLLYAGCRLLTNCECNLNVNRRLDAPTTLLAAMLGVKIFLVLPPEGAPRVISARPLGFVTEKGACQNVKVEFALK
jgi:hypothetical protein